MGEDGILSREWVEIVLVLEDCTLIDSAYDLHVFDGRKALAPGFYLAVHRCGEREFPLAELVGPYEQRGFVEMLYDTALHLGAATEADAPEIPGEAVSILPSIRRQAAERILVAV